MQGPGEKIQWCQAVWNHHNVPKHSFVGWLAMRNKLQTRSKLAALGICGTNTCLLCENAVEDHNLLFFQCDYIKQCITKVKTWLGVKARTCNLPQLDGWIQRRYRGGKFRWKVVVAGILATVYKLWEKRNNALWNYNIHTIEKVVKEIQYSVKHRVKSRLPRRILDEDIQWLYSL